MDWIKCSDHLPPTEDKNGELVECLVVDADGEYGVGFYRDDINAWDSCNWGFLEVKDLVDNHEAFTRPCGIGKVVAWCRIEKPELIKPMGAPYHD